MAESRCSYPVVLIHLLTAIASGSEDITKFVCSGDSVQMFNRIEVNNSRTIVSLYKNGDKERMIASWTIGGVTISKENKENLILDEDKNIWIINVHPSGEGKYVLQNDTDNNISSSAVHLSVLVAPLTTCKPKIKKVDNILKTYLERVGDCGTPPASVYWLEYPGVTNEGSKDLLELQSGREAGTYYACIEGAAMRCARSWNPASNYCSSFLVETSVTKSGTDDSKTALLGVAVGTILVLQILVTADLMCKKWKKRKKCKQRHREVRELDNLRPRNDYRKHEAEE